MILDSIIALFAPYECLGCGTEGHLLCSRCQTRLAAPISRCYHCQRPTADFRTCADCLTQTPLAQLVAVTRYAGLAKALVKQLKFHSARAATAEMAQLLMQAQRFAVDALVVPVPTATGRVRARSYDQAELFAKAFARRSHLTYRPLLRRLGQAHQVGSGRRERFEQLAGAYRLVRPVAVAGRHIILIDDVSTTGATLDAAARIMQQAGAARVTAAVFAQA